MAAVDYRSLAVGIVQEVGGEANIASATHCAHDSFARRETFVVRAQFQMKSPAANGRAL